MCARQSETDGTPWGSAAGSAKERRPAADGGGRAVATVRVVASATAMSRKRVFLSRASGEGWQPARVRAGLDGWMGVHTAGTMRMGFLLLLFWGLLACPPRPGWEAGRLAGWVVLFLVRRQGVLDGPQAGPCHGLSAGKRDMIFMARRGSGMGSCFLPGKEMAVCPGYFHISTEVCGVCYGLVGAVGPQVRRP